MPAAGNTGGTYEGWGFGPNPRCFLGDGQLLETGFESRTPYRNT
jgi:hypothetical protein